MKAGDKVWLYFPFDNDAIYECEVDEWPENQATFSYRIIEHPRQKPYIALKADAFLSREALCEHYRKIFE